VALLDRIKQALARHDEHATREILEMPTTRIADATGGERVRVSGRVVESPDHGLLTAPFTGRGVVWFHARYDKFHLAPPPTMADYLGGGLLERAMREQWWDLIDHATGVPFLIDDGTGTLARVDGTHAAALRLSEKALADVSYVDSVPSAFRTYMTSLGAQTERGMASNSARHRFFETSFVPGDPIVVVGTARREPGSIVAEGYRSAATEVVALDAPLIIPE
jgi:hypothetical protein